MHLLVPSWVKVKFLIAVYRNYSATSVELTENQVDFNYETFYLFSDQILNVPWGNFRLMRYLLSLTLLFSASQLYSQTLLGSGGNNGNLVSFSIGESFIGGGSSGSIQITQGFQQPNLWGVKIQEQDIFEIKAYPNPVKDYLTLQVLQDLKEDCTLHLYSSEGKSVFSRPLSGPSEVLDFSLYAAGTYTLIVLNQEGQLASFRIVKTK
jgi:hypothetical protein